ncbi:MAG: protein kinase [Bacillota bacterium]|nr:protein kinase [Bacillota bacterium]
MKDTTTIADSSSTIISSGEILPEEETARNSASFSPEEQFINAATEIKKGDMLLDLYKVEDGPINGGMGAVFRVHHTGWNTDLAVKQPRAGMFRNQEQKAVFIRECEAWINLGLHPHIVSCYYVREINGIPSIFAEWMEGGSLENRIEDGILYSGSDEEILERILDISIQFARGLHYAHEQGLIHQDVKPDNLLLNNKGEAKVADFGIAKARAYLSGPDNRMSMDGTMLSAGGAYTPAYCSIEQINGWQLTRRTDIWSWAVSVLEMFIGERLWQSGTIAGLGCEDYFETTRIDIPESMKALLRHCFREKEAERPHDFGEIEAVLLEIYENAAGKTYFREVSEAASDTADSLNNKALSFLDLGRPELAESYWKDALKLNPNHVPSVYNQNLYLWRSAIIDDEAAIRSVAAVHSNVNNHESVLALSQIWMECAMLQPAVKLLEEGYSKFNGDKEITSLLRNARTGLQALPSVGELLTGIDTIEAAACSPDGTKVLIGLLRSKMRLIDLMSSECLWNLEEYKRGGGEPIHSVSFSRDGRLMFSADRSEGKIWDTKSKKKLRAFPCEDREILAACTDGNTGSVILCGKVGYVLHIRNSLFPRKRAFSGHTAQVNSVCISSDGKLALTGSGNEHMINGDNSGDNTLRLWNIDDGSCLRIFEGHSTAVRAVSFLKNGTWALSCSEDKTLKLWDIESGNCLHTFTGHTYAVTCMALHPDGGLIASGDAGNNLKLWDLKSGRCLRTISFCPGEWCHYISCLTFTPNGKHLIYGGGLNATTLYSAEVAAPYITAPWMLSRIRTVRDSLDNDSLFKKALSEAQACLNDRDIAAALEKLKLARSVKGYENASAALETLSKISRYCIRKQFLGGWIEGEIEANQGKIASAAIHPSGNVFASCGESCEIKLWSMTSKQCILELSGHTQKIESVCFGPDGRYLLSGSADKTAKLWSADDGRCLYTFDKFSRTVNRVSFSPDGKSALFLSGMNSIDIVDLETRQYIYRDGGYSNLFSSAAFSPDGKSFVYDNCYTEYDTDETEYHELIAVGLKTRKALLSITGLHRERCHDVCFSPDGLSIYSGSCDGYIGISSASDGRSIERFPAHSSEVNALQLSPDGKYLLSAGSDRKVILWDADTGRDLFSFSAHKASVNAAALSNCCRYAVTGGSDGIIRIYYLDWEYEFPGWSDWDDGAEPYLKIFLALHPDYTESDFERLATELQRRGFGWLRPGGVRQKLAELKKLL